MRISNTPNMVRASVNHTYDNNQAANKPSFSSNLNNVSNSVESMSGNAKQNTPFDIDDIISSRGRSGHKTLYHLLIADQSGGVHREIMKQLNEKGEKTVREGGDTVANNLLIGSMSCNETALGVLDFMKANGLKVSDKVLSAVLHGPEEYQSEVHKEIIRMADKDAFSAYLDKYKSKYNNDDSAMSILNTFNDLLKNRSESPRNVAELRDSKNQNLLTLFKKNKLNNMMDFINNVKNHHAKYYYPEEIR